MKQETFDCDSCGETFPESDTHTPDKDGDTLLCETCYMDRLLDNEARVDLKPDPEDLHLEQGLEDWRERRGA